MLISCGGRSPKEHSQAANPATRPGANVDATRRLLEGNGIGSIKFGQPRAAATADLERLLGPPHETVPGICGFGRTTDWIGLGINSHAATPSAQLTPQFKHSRFVGYEYSENAEAPAARPHGVPFATTGGLTVGDTTSRARQLYEQAFVETSVPQGTPPAPRLPRLPVGEVSTASGEISAGAGPNTPCR